VSKRVKVRLMLMRVLEKTDHKNRVELDRKIEEKTGKPCDEGVDELSDEDILDLLRLIWRKRKKKVLEEYVV